MAYSDAQLVELKALLDVDHPISGTWAADDQTAADQGNVKDVPFEVELTQDTLLTFLLNEENDGSNLLGRLHLISAVSHPVLNSADVYINPQVDMGDGGGPTTVLPRHIASAFALVQIITGGTDRPLPDKAAMAAILDNLDADQSDVMTNAQKHAMLSFYDGIVSLMTANNLPRVRGGDIENARALP